VLADDIRARISRHTQAEDLARLIRTTVDFAKGPGPFA
jgi:hypothetical protein